MFAFSLHFEHIPTTHTNLAFYLESGLVLVVDLFEWDELGGDEVRKFGEVHAIAQSLLQFCRRRQLLVDTRLYPPEVRHTKVSPWSF